MDTNCPIHDKEEFFNSLEASMKRQTEEAAPYYFVPDDTTGLLFPLYFNGDTGNPLVALVLKQQQENKFVLSTVLRIKDAYMDARVVGPVNANWLTETTKDSK